MYFDWFEGIQPYVSLKKLSYTADNEDAAIAAKEILNLEDTAPPELVKDLIRDQVSADTQSLRVELS